MSGDVDQGEDVTLEQLIEGLVGTIEGQQAAIGELQQAGERRNRPPAGSRPSRLRRTQVLAGGRTAGRRPWWDMESLPPADRVRLGDDMQAWGNWLRSVYRIQALPSDWFDSTALRAEVLALYASWRAAYKHRGASPEQPSQWHETLARFITRVEEYNTRAGRNLVAAVEEDLPELSDRRAAR